jgi:hypothetical protein
MPYRTDPKTQPGVVARLAGVAMGLLVLIKANADGSEASQPTAQVIYREADDPVIEVLGRAGSRIFSDDPKDYTDLASDRGLRELDQAISKRPGDPRLHWFRYLTLDRAKRTAEARAAREEAIRLARIVPGGDDLLPEYYREHAKACAKEARCGREPEPGQHRVLARRQDSGRGRRLLARRDCVGKRQRSESRRARGAREERYCRGLFAGWQNAGDRQRGRRPETVGHACAFELEMNRRALTWPPAVLCKSQMRRGTVRSGFRA